MDVLTTRELQARLDHPALKLIDIRPVAAYNGWRLKGESRGGHIKKARSLPFKWLQYIDWLDIVQSKGIEQQHALVIYGYDMTETEQVAEHFKRAGYRDVSLYYDFLKAWSGQPERPMSRLKRYRQLVSAEWLQGLLETGQAEGYNQQRFVLCHCHYRNKADYESRHIPGAIELDTNTLESPKTWNRRSPRELKATLERCDITHDTTVILYGRFSAPDNSDPFPGSSAGQLAAMRCAFIMLYAGVCDVRVLDGGLQAWEDAGLASTTQSADKQPVADFGVKIPQNPQYAVDLPQAREMLSSADSNLVSVRSWPEFIGEVSGYNYIARQGRIPGALFGNCGSDAYHMENYRNLDHTMREYHEIAQLWAAAGITPDRHNAFYCGTGWRGSEAFFCAWLMGWPRVSVFDGGWFEWSQDPDNPIETGRPTRGMF